MRYCLTFLLLMGLFSACSSSSGTVTPKCYYDSDCAAGEQCKGGECVTAGCASDSDCRGGATCQAGSCQDVSGCGSDAGCNGWFCVAASCVQCKATDDCPQGQKCLSGVCRPQCQSNEDCTAPAAVCDWLTGVCVACLDDSDCAAPHPACDTYRGVCLECLNDDHCGTGKICRDRVCVAGGCTGDEDCAEPTPRCDTQSGECVQCLTAGDCQTGQQCVDHACQQSVSCSVDSDCSAPTPYCVQNVCVECRNTSNCSNGYHCEDYSCVPGECAGSDDCPAERPYCDTQSDPSRCVQCRGEEDCANLPDAAHCLLDQGTCVQCLRNAHCAEDATCSTTTHSCIGGFTACSLCVQKRCQSGAFCAVFQDSNGTTVDSGCVHICLDGTDCAKGYFCSPSPGGVNTNICLPAYNRELGTCEAIRDIGITCRGNADCGVSSVNDAICVGAVQGACTIICKADTDCPGTLVCIPNPASPGEGNICAPH